MPRILAFVAFSLFLSILASVAVAAQLEQVVVTATRRNTGISHIGDSISVIDAEQVRASQKLMVPDLLTTTPGVIASRNGGYGGTTSVRIRGGEDHHTVVLIDGVKLHDPSLASGGFNFAHFMLGEGIERIEILRGAKSTLWGSQAIGGVVNIVTTAPKGPLAAGIAGEGGSYSTGRLSAHVQQGTDRYGWRLSGHYFRTDGVSAFDEDAGGEEDDGYRNYGFNARGVGHVTDSVTAELRLSWWRGRTEFDATTRDTREYGITREWVNHAAVNIDSLQGRLQHRIGVTFTDTDRNNQDPDAAVRTTFDAFGRNLRYEYQGTWSPTERVTAVFGLERERAEMSSASPTESSPDPTSLKNHVAVDGTYAQLQFTPIDGLTLTGGLRYDDHDAFGRHTSGQAAIAWSATRSTLLRASYGEGFKAPTLYQLYSEYGTPSLKPEEGKTWDVGVEQRWFSDRIIVSATYFERKTDNMIDFVSCFSVASARCDMQPLGYYENVTRTKADGYELSLTAQLSTQWTATANYTYLDAKNDARSSTNFGNELPRRPNQSAYAELRYRWSLPLVTTIAAQYSGRTYDNAANIFRLDEYVLFDMRAEYAFSDALKLYGRIENLFNKDYSTILNYGSLGRGVYVGFRQSF
jgi:vitamin B12 transporter